MKHLILASMITLFTVGGASAGWHWHHGHHVWHHHHHVHHGK